MTMTDETTRNEGARLEARIKPEKRSTIKRAAEIEGRSLSDFVVDAAFNKALSVIERAEIVRLSIADQESFARALMSPPEAAPALKRAFSRRSKLLKPE